MKITALVRSYNECQFISACIESIKHSVDQIIFADGAYELYYRNYKKYFPQAKPWSTDGTLEIIQSLKDLPDLKILRCQKPYVNQLAMLNRLLDAVKTGRWFLLLDADEMVLGDLKTGFKEIKASGSIIGRAPLCTLGADADRLHYFWHPRVFKKQRGMKYSGTHWQLRDYAGRIMENSYPVWWTQHFVIAHLKLLKTHTRIRPHLSYMDRFRSRGYMEPSQVEVDKARIEGV